MCPLSIRLTSKTVSSFLGNTIYLMRKYVEVCVQKDKYIDCNQNGNNVDSYHHPLNFSNTENILGYKVSQI